MRIELYRLEKSLKHFLLILVITLSFGVLTGLIYLQNSTNMTPKGTVVQFNGSDEVNEEDEFAIKTEYPKPFTEMLLTTHTHVISFGFLFFSVGMIFYCNTILNGKLKYFLMSEPLISTMVTFGSLWAVRFIHSGFVYLTIISAVLMYASYFIMTGVIIWELLFKKQNKLNERNL